jgi:hypothetical protein
MLVGKQLASLGLSAFDDSEREQSELVGGGVEDSQEWSTVMKLRWEEARNLMLGLKKRS